MSQRFATPWTIAYHVPVPMEFPKENPGVDSQSLLQGIFLTQGSNQGLLHCRQNLYHQGSQIYDQRCTLVAIKGNNWAVGREDWKAEHYTQRATVWSWYNREGLDLRSQQGWIEWDVLGSDVLFIIGDWKAKAQSQDTPGVTGKFGLRVQNGAGQRLNFANVCLENTLVIANTLF